MNKSSSSESDEPSKNFMNISSIINSVEETKWNTDKNVSEINESSVTSSNNSSNLSFEEDFPINGELVSNDHFNKLLKGLVEMINELKEEEKEQQHRLVVLLRRTISLNYIMKFSPQGTKMKLFPCNYEQCYNVYQSKGSLRRHVYSHTGERPYKCFQDNCEKSYSSSDRLAEHIHSHTNLRPYKCNYQGCSKKYNDPKTLREHRKTHGNKNFICECGKSFHRRTHLKQHMLIHDRKTKLENDISVNSYIDHAIDCNVNDSFGFQTRRLDHVHFEANKKR